MPSTAQRGGVNNAKIFICTWPVDSVFLPGMGAGLGGMDNLTA